MNLKSMTAGECGTITKLPTEPVMRRRLIEMGVCEGTLLRCVTPSRRSGMSAMLARGVVLALRDEDAEKIIVQS